MSKRPNSSWRTIRRPLWKLRAATILSKSARGSGSPVSTCAVMCASTSHSQHEVLHELARQLDGVPLDALQAGDAGQVDARQQLVQAMAELVEQRDDVVVREQRRLAADRRGEVAREVRDRMLHALVDAPAVDRVVHPRAALLAFARIEVEIELADDRARARRGCGRSAPSDATSARVGGLDLHAVDRLDHAEQPGEHALLGEVLLHLLLGERVAARLAAARTRSATSHGAEVGDAELVAREVGELGVVALGERRARARRDRAGTRAPRRACAPSWRRATPRRSSRSRGAALPRAAARGCAR